MKTLFARNLRALAIAVALAGALLTPHSALFAAAEHVKHVDDLTGSWTWEGTTESAIPPFIVEMIGQGIVPEGEITYLSCENSGQLEIVQTGDTFEGSATQNLVCMTEGGQGPFSPPAFAPQFAITGGVISGKYISFNFGTCDFTAKVVGSGNKLMGDGTCEIPLPPPYFLRLTHWKAQQ